MHPMVCFLALFSNDFLVLYLLFWFAINHIYWCRVQEPFLSFNYWRCVYICFVSFVLLLSFSLLGVHYFASDISCVSQSHLSLFCVICAACVFIWLMYLEFGIMPLMVYESECLFLLESRGNWLAFLLRPK